MSSSRYGHRFAAFGVAGSTASLLLLALLCHSRLGHRLDMLHSSHPSDSASNKHEIVYRQRALQQWNHSELYHEAHAANVASSPPCEDIFKNLSRNASWQDAPTARYLCGYATHCDGDWPSSALLPLILCRGVDLDANATAGGFAGAEGDTNTIFQTSMFIHFILPPLLLCYLYLLFRLLATTADSYFSPALETFSFEMGLPPRFAGAVSVFVIYGINCISFVI